MSNPLLGRNKDGSLLLLPAVYLSPTYQKSLAVGTLHCKGPIVYKAATLAPVFWQATINSCPSPYASYPQFSSPVFIEGDNESDNNMLAFSFGGGTKVDGEWQQGIGYGVYQGYSIYNYFPNRTPTDLVSPIATVGGIDIYPPMMSLFVSSYSHTIPGGTKPSGAADESGQISVMLRFGAFSVANDYVIWGVELDSPWPDVMKLDGLTLPFGQQTRYYDGDHGEAGQVDWSGTSIYLSRIAKPGDTYAGRPSVG
jgi:hypothetical protein